MMNSILWPFGLAFMGLFGIIALLVVIFWVWMIIDCVQRNFRNDVEKIVWVLVLVFGSWVGAIVYYFAIVVSNPSGLAKKR